MRKIFKRKKREDKENINQTKSDQITNKILIYIFKTICLFVKNIKIFLEWSNCSRWLPVDEKYKDFLEVV